MTDNYQKLLIDRKPDQVREVWVLVWGDNCANAGNIIKADEGGWLMFESETHANAMREYWNWPHSIPVKLADLMAPACGIATRRIR